MPVALISTRTSPAFGPSMSIVSMLSGSPAFQATAARVCIDVSLTFPASGRRGFGTLSCDAPNAIVAWKSNGFDGRRSCLARLLNDFHERTQGILHAVAGLCRQHQRRFPASLFQLCTLRFDRLFRRCIRFGQRDDLGLVGQPVAIGFELAADNPVGFAGVLARAVDE